MDKQFVEDKVFKEIDFTSEGITKSEFDNCSFNRCNFTNTDLSEMVFSDCRFENCDLSLAKLKNSEFKETEFKNCKMLGLRFDQCNNFLLSFNFEDCILNYSSFFKLKLKNTKFIDCKMEGVEFGLSDLTSSTFLYCDLSRAIFENTVLTGADLRTSYNFSIDPELNRINNAKFTLRDVGGLLDKYNIIIE